MTAASTANPRPAKPALPGPDRSMTTATTHPRHGPADDGTADPSAPPPRLTPEVVLRRGIIHTNVSRPVAWAMTATFLAILAAVPVAQAIVEWRRGGGAQALEVFRHAPTQSALHRYE